MNHKLLSSLFIFASIPTLIAATAINSQAQTWDYSADGVGDDLGVWQGNHRNSFDMLGMGIKDDGKNVYVGILSKLNHTGLNIDRVGTWDVENNNIGYGDFFFDFTGGGNFRDNVKHGNVLGVKFLWGNDSDPYIGTGVYDNIQAIGVQDKNAGYGNIGRYYNSVN
ncbi:MAG: hypothetical protein HC857_09950, partial [Synechococcales cyanobacterium RU_4_20]|nr:hypothetical protein [Synechococcales cyanobacterium RU_4_20]